MQPRWIAKYCFICNAWFFFSGGDNGGGGGDGSDIIIIEGRDSASLPAGNQGEMGHWAVSYTSPQSFDEILDNKLIYISYDEKNATS